MAFLLARQQLGPRADDLLGGVEEVVAVGGVARRRRRRDAHPLDTELVHRGPVLAQHGHRPLDGLGREPAGRVDALPEPRDPHAPVDRRERAVAGRLADEQADRVRAAVDRGDAAGHGVDSVARTEPVVDPTADRIVAAGEEPGVVRVQALHARARAADAAERPRPGVVGRNGGVALARVPLVRGRERGRVDRRAPPRARRRADSSSDTRVRSGSPTSQ